MNLSETIKEELLSMGAAMSGFADLSCVPAECRRGFGYGISFAIALEPAAVRAIRDVPNTVYYNEYQRANERLDEMNERIAEFIRKAGHGAYPNTRKNVVTDQSNKRTPLPHKTVATLAGLGWIGKCALLVNEKYGAAFRLTTVLTDAVLETGVPVTESRCGGCSRCGDVCPANAVTGKEWHSGMDRDEFFRALDCRDAIAERGARYYQNRSDGNCGLCILECPWTQKYLGSAK